LVTTTSLAVHATGCGDAEPDVESEVLDVGDEGVTGGIAVDTGRGVGADEQAATARKAVTNAAPLASRRRVV
jgi:hypothetical protein